MIFIIFTQPSKISRSAIFLLFFSIILCTDEGNVLNVICQGNRHVHCLCWRLVFRASPARYVGGEMNAILGERSGVTGKQTRERRTTPAHERDYKPVRLTCYRRNAKRVIKSDRFICSGMCGENRRLHAYVFQACSKRCTRSSYRYSVSLRVLSLPHAYHGILSSVHTSVFIERSRENLLRN